MTFEVVPFEPVHAPAAATIFTDSLAVLRHAVPALSAALTDRDEVVRRLQPAAGCAALQDGRLVGYLTGHHPIARFRRTARVGAYVAEWAHGVAHQDVTGVYSAMYRAVAREWATAGCDVHVITILADQPSVIDAWFRAGFGMALVDAVRPARPVGAATPAGVTIRAATDADVPDLVRLDAEHVRHYAESPVFMASPIPYDDSAWRRFLATPGNGAWLASDGDEAVAFMRFDSEFDGAAVTEDAEGVFISGAFVRPSHRGRGIAAAVLDAALRQQEQFGRRCCALDFESFNPEAGAFWSRHFTPVCVSLMRVPEAFGS